jgi:hypothetical protein
MKIPNIDSELPQDWLNALCTRIQDSISFFLKKKELKESKSKPIDVDFHADIEETEQIGFSEEIKKNFNELNNLDYLTNRELDLFKEMIEENVGEDNSHMKF